MNTDHSSKINNPNFFCLITMVTGDCDTDYDPGVTGDYHTDYDMDYYDTAMIILVSQTWFTAIRVVNGKSMNSPYAIFILPVVSSDWGLPSEFALTSLIASGNLRTQSATKSNQEEYKRVLCFNFQELIMFN